MARPQAVPLAHARRSARPRRLVLALAVLVVALVGTFAWLVVTAPAEGPAAGGTYREAVVGPPIELDPLVARRLPRDPDPTRLLFRGLVQVDARGQPSPDLAERWEVSSEGRVYRFSLRPGLRWDDGEPITAADVLFTVRRAARQDPAQPAAPFWAAVEARAVAPDAVEFVLREPLGAFLEHASLPIVAAHAPPDPGVARPAASGPYRLAEAEPGSVALERNPAYDGPPPLLDRLEFRTFPSREAAVQALRGGQVDGFGGLTAAEAALLGGLDRVAVRRATEYNKHGLLVLNAQRGVFRDRAVRQAAAQAIDRAALIAAALDGEGEPAVGPLSPLSWAFDSTVRYRSYDPDAARALLAGAGWQGGEPGGPLRKGGEALKLELVVADSAPRLREAAEVSRQLEAIGFRVERSTVASEALLKERLEPGAFDAALIGRWLPEADPDQFALWHSTQARSFGDNYGGISSPDLDRWLEVGRRQVDPAARAEAYRRFQAVWNDEQPAVPLYHPRTAYALSRDLRGVEDSPLPDVSWRLRQVPAWYRDPPLPFGLPRLRLDLGPFGH